MPWGLGKTVSGFGFRFCFCFGAVSVFGLAGFAAEPAATSKPCLVFKQGAHKLLAARDGERFKTHVLAEAALSQLRSYPSRTAKGEAQCAPAEHRDLWVATLESARHFSLPENRTRLMAEAALTQLKDEVAPPASLEKLSAVLDILERLQRLKYVTPASTETVQALRKRFHANLEAIRLELEKFLPTLTPAH